MDNEEFEVYFDECLNSPQIYETRLNHYWQHGNLDKYYFTMRQCKSEGFRIQRNPDGKHKIEKRWD